MKKIVFTFGILFTFFLNAQIYTNGELATGIMTARDDAAPDGYQWSEVQANSGDLFTANAALGQAAVYNNQGTLNIYVADDFIVPVGETWDITSFDFFGYATDFGLTPPGNPIDVLRVAVYNGDPELTSSTIVAGSLITNVFDLANSPEAFLYRTSYTIGDVGVAPDLLRKIWQMRGTVTTSLTAGTYWVMFQTHEVDNFGIFFPSNTIIGNRGLPSYNAKGKNIVTGLWFNSIDQGLPATAPDYTSDYPFKINGTISSLVTKENDLSRKVSIYPNPVNDFIKVESKIEISSIEILDISGRMIKNQLIYSNNSIVNFSDVSSGNYILKINSPEGVLNKKIVKN